MNIIEVCDIKSAQFDNRNSIQSYIFWFGLLMTAATLIFGIVQSVLVYRGKLHPFNPRDVEAGKHSISATALLPAMFVKRDLGKKEPSADSRSHSCPKKARGTREGAIPK